MKIAVLGPCDVQGLVQNLPLDVDKDHGSALIRDIVDGYLKHGHRVRMVKFCKHADQPVTRSLGEASVTVLPRRSRGYQLTADLWRRERDAAVQAIKAFDPDVVHAHWTYEYARAAIASGYPHVVTARDIPSRLFPLMRPRYYWWPRLLQGYLVARQARWMSGQSPYTVNLWKTEIGRKGPMELVPNAVPDWLTQLPQRQREASLVAPVYVSASNGFAKLKNATTLLEAFGLVRESIGGAGLLLYGTGFEPNGQAEIWARQRGLEAGVEFRGPTSHREMLIAIRNEADVMVHPSLEESFGNTVAEAMALGMTVVGGQAAGAVPWLLDDGRAGVLCDVSSAGALARAMLEALHRTELGERAWRRVREEFTLEPTINAYLALLGKAAGR